ncbi:hypothetical protein [Paraliomyxa miuraensis]|uniref:hypothetical protein n=1 Tax=Paraliomyxa miuraensis TaxID=376150 RepID=UPI0022572152|nr:hypothetical protein [Paraliomyxa miuraensis]MCX4244520.1 hypothetical protein [Paraliomyxa miuraensis]
MGSTKGSGAVANVLAWSQRAASTFFGLATLLVALSVLATLPVLQLLCLGYLLVAGARVAASGRLRGCLPGLPLFERVGAIVVGLWLLLWIPRLLASLARDARLIDPGGRAGPTLDTIAALLVLLLVLHAIAATARGGRLSLLLLPRPILEARALRALLTREGYRTARDAVWDALASLEPWALVKTGALGFLAAALWLLVPTTLLALGSRAPVLAVLGAGLMAVVVFYLPLLQLHVAEQGRLAALMDVETVARAHARAPLASAVAVVITVVFAFPLYLLKIELIPREAMWLPGVAFMALMLPARLVCGLALHRGLARSTPRHFALRAVAWLIVVPVAGAYAVVLYFTQYLSWYGTWSLYEQHAFLLPVPFLGL